MSSKMIGSILIVFGLLVVALALFLPASIAGLTMSLIGGSSIGVGIVTWMNV